MSSLQQSLVTTSDETHLHSVKSPSRTATSEQASQSHSNYLSSPSLSPASPPIASLSQRTPNVYINGLPPHYSEQELFALARPFGDIKSVRTFTRHVSEKPTGYGFVLFDDVDSAQRCIEGLRKYRNIHPSFSKQVHRIPGTEYAQQNAVQTNDMDENSFKSRMEKLKDTTSTNLYIEGLPLSIDAESLAALMGPHKIKSSRFFKTKLSNPPRIIAFVRLETRAAAEDTIERLHGRLVRGWNDPGCRISVRFADSAEQRELRRTERTLKNGDQSPSRLTIAQAALLNLRGQELQANDLVGSKPQRLTSSRSDNVVAFDHGLESGLLAASSSLPSKLYYPYGESPPPSISEIPGASDMDCLLQSIQNMGYDDETLDDAIRSLTLDNEYLLSRQAQLRALARATLLPPNPLLNASSRGHTQARNGFTPAEEIILEAHTQRLQLQAQLPRPMPIFEPAASSGRNKSNVRGLDPLPNELPLRSGLSGNTILPQDTLPTISEADFHAISHPPRDFAQPSHNFQTLVDSCSPSVLPATMNTILVRPPNRAVSIVPPPPDYEAPGKRLKGHHQSTQPSSASEHIPCLSSTFNNHQSASSGDTKLRPSLVQASTRPNNNSNDSNDNLNGTKNPELQHATYTYSHGDARSDRHAGKGSLPSSASQIYTKKSPRLDEQHLTAKDGPKSPAVLSPALTYSSRSPSTMSPATPFFGSFTGNQDTFEVVTMESDDVAERKLKVRVADK